jgi:hypothetical protein
MAEYVRHGTFVQRSGTGLQEVTGVGFRPKALFVFGVHRPALEAWDEIYVWQYGFTDGTTSVAFGAVSQDGEGTSDTQRTWEEGAIHRHESGPTIFRATFQEFTDDGFIVNWTNVGLARVTLQYLAIGGDEVTADVGSFLTGTVDEAEIEETISFEPTLVLFAPVPTTATSGGTTGMNMPALGFTDGTNQGTIAVNSVNGAGTSNTHRYQRTNHCISWLNDSTGAIQMQAEIVSFAADAFTVRIKDVSTDQRVYYLALGNVTAVVGAFNQRTSTGGQSITGLAFDPQALLTMSVQIAAAATVQDQNRLMIGAAGGGSAGASWAGDADNEGVTINARRQTAQGVVLFADPAAAFASSTVVAQAAFTQFTTGGFDLNWTTADATARQVLYVAFLGGASADVEAEPTFPSAEAIGGQTIGDTWVEVRNWHLQTLGTWTEST